VFFFFLPLIVSAALVFWFFSSPFPELSPGPEVCLWRRLCWPSFDSSCSFAGRRCFFLVRSFFSSTFSSFFCRCPSSQFPSLLGSFWVCFLCSYFSNSLMRRPTIITCLVFSAFSFGFFFAASLETSRLFFPFLLRSFPLVSLGAVFSRSLPY